MKRTTTEDLKNDEVIATLIAQMEADEQTREWLNNNPDVVEASMKAENGIYDGFISQYDYNRYPYNARSPHGISSQVRQDYYIPELDDLPDEELLKLFHDASQEVKPYDAREIRGAQREEANRFDQNRRNANRGQNNQSNFNRRIQNPRQNINRNENPRPNINRNENQRNVNYNQRLQTNRNIRGRAQRPGRGNQQFGLGDYMINSSDEEMKYEDLVRLDDHEYDKGNGFKSIDLSRLKPKIYFAKSKITLENCPICMNGYQDGNKYITLKCNHTYHDSCIKEWLSRKKVCAICKAEIKL
ncbi:hypothetical protein SteCoe_29061 [Stentor coeruleus]|uniref:RING-type E3 ubiquitin transferase n=1 Tax=Stentor coeruleus TaxID=5963 RepID=A0A1R2B6V7_9CILI|nr:hypothetical protein SteCoe_29061 [Stentor coeruleus]